MAQEPTKQPAGKQIQIPMPAEVVRGTHANHVGISFTPDEFILDFAALNLAQGNGIATNRIFMSPRFAKQMTDLLNRMIAQYEGQRGQTHVPASEQTSEIGFQTT